MWRRADRLTGATVAAALMQSCGALMHCRSSCGAALGA